MSWGKDYIPNLPFYKVILCKKINWLYINKKLATAFFLGIFGQCIHIKDVCCLCALLYLSVFSPSPQPQSVQVHTVFLVYPLCLINNLVDMKSSTNEYEPKILKADHPTFCNII